MNLLAERTEPPLRGRLAACPCGLPGCHEVFIVVQLTGSREDLWLSVGVGRTLKDGVHMLDRLLRDPMQPFGQRSLRDVIERGLAMVGLTWEELGRADALELQTLAWVEIPEWMERLPAGYLWKTRGVVFGRQLTRVVTALEAVDYCYVPDMDIEGAGERPGPLDQPREWGVVDNPLAETLAPPDRWYSR